VLAVEGDPPERYEFVYQLRGAVREDGGTPRMAQSHRVAVSLPFGYPHLPPSCKPLSPIFHPNFDPDAVQIGDFWHPDRGLAELVLHLGRMLCGQAMDLGEPFNPEAAAWYAARTKELPWDRLEPGGGPAATTPSPGVADILHMDTEADRDSPAPPPDTSDFREEEPEPSRSPNPPLPPGTWRPRDEAALPIARSPRLLFGSMAAIILLLSMSSSWLLFGDRSRERDAAAALRQAQQHMQEQRFDEARETAERGADILRGLRLPPGQKSREVRQAIVALLQSRELSEGLRGNLPYQGAFLPRETIALLEAGREQMARAETLARENRWQEAAALYEQALRVLKKTGAGTDEREHELRLRLARAKLQTLLQGAQEAEASTNWQEAASHYREASELARSLDDALGKTDLEKRVAEVELRHLQEQGRRAMQEGNWALAVDSFRQSLALSDAAAAPATLNEELRAELRQADFSRLLAEARQATEQAAWETAMRRYNDALAILRETPRTQNLGESAEKLRRSRLLVLLARERDLADGARRRKNSGEELTHLRNLLAELKRNELRGDDQLRQLRQETDRRIAVLEQEEQVARLTRQLNERFNDIFLENYPSSRASQLLQPRVSFLRQEGGTYLFNLQCVELNEGRYFRLELNYLYDAATEKWRLVPGGK